MKVKFNSLRSLYLYFGEAGNHVNSPTNKLSDSDKGDKPRDMIHSVEFTTLL